MPRNDCWNGKFGEWKMAISLEPTSYNITRIPKPTKYFHSEIRSLRVDDASRKDTANHTV